MTIFWLHINSLYLIFKNYNLIDEEIDVLFIGIICLRILEVLIFDAVDALPGHKLVFCYLNGNIKTKLCFIAITKLTNNWLRIEAFTAAKVLSSKVLRHFIPINNTYISSSIIFLIF